MSKKTSICLAMIVKDEAHVIERCLRSVLPLVTNWSIVDTGSTDGTQDLIRKVLKKVPGELHECPWRNFGANRTEAIQYAKGHAEYMLLMDADEEFRAPQGFVWPRLQADAYALQMGDGDNRYRREVLIKSSLPWRYEGVLHEYLTCDAPYQSEILDGPLVFGHFDGGRSQGIDQKTKYERDAKLLELELRKDPKNSRNVFYLAQSHRDCGQFAKALEAYQRRVDMGGWEEEIWYSLLQIAIMSERMQEPESQIVPRYLDAYQYRPSRAEPLVYLATLYRNAGKHALAYLVASMARQIERPSDLLFLDQSCYMWRALDEYSIACYYTGRYEESRLACQSLLEGSRLPASERERVLQNLEFASNQPGSP